MSETLAQLPGGIGISQVLAIWLIVVVATVLRAFTGFGFALAAVPGFALLMAPTQAVVLCAALSLVVSLLALPTYWGRASPGRLLPMLATALVGTVFGASLLRWVSAAQFQLVIGVSVIAACALMTLYRPRQPLRAGSRWGWVAGLASGLMNGALAIPGPPVVIYALAAEPEPERSRALLMTFFLFSAVLALGTYAVAGFFTAGAPWRFLLALPALYLGDRFGYWLFRRYGSRFYRRAALMVLLVMGGLITLRALSPVTA